MRLQEDPKLPQGDLGRLVTTLTDRLRSISRKINSVAESRISGRHNADTAAPTGGNYTQGDFVPNSAPTEHGVAGSKYVVTGWTCVASGSPGTWVECRSLTGG